MFLCKPNTNSTSIARWKLQSVSNANPGCSGGKTFRHHLSSVKKTKQIGTFETFSVFKKIELARQLFRKKRETVVCT